MKHSQIWNAVQQHFYMKDYDGKIGKTAAALADEMLAVLNPLLDSMPVPEVPKPEDWVTIGGVKYKLEEIKK